ncbi:unnamed protein product [Dicrocoelium dendriticum]|nr:unnamed protein product [Dicrocoelium dendriticum]
MMEGNQLAIISVAMAAVEAENPVGGGGRGRTIPLQSLGGGEGHASARGEKSPSEAGRLRGCMRERERRRTRGGERGGGGSKTRLDGGGGGGGWSSVS